MRRPRFAILAAAPLLALVAGQSMAVGQAEGDLRVTASLRVTQDDVSPTRTYGAPYMSVNPENPDIIVAATPEMRSRACRLMRTMDGGRSWRLMDAFPAPQSYPFCFHTSATHTVSPVEFGRDGNLYYGLTGWDSGDLGVGAEVNYTNYSVLLSRSSNLGESWDPVVVRNARGKTGRDTESNRPITGLAVDRWTGNQDIVYIGWNQQFPQAQPAQSSQGQVATSTDGGRTFGEPVKIVGDYWKSVANKPDPEKWGGSSPSLAVGDDGTLYAVFFASATGQPAGTELNSLMLGTSRDQGKTFEITVIAPPSGYYQATPVVAWSPEGGPQGSLHIVYEDKVALPALGDRDTFTRRSTDGGKTWSEAKQINDDAVSTTEGGHTQTNPAVRVAPNGRVDATWWDFRNDNGLFINDVYYAYSEDNGATWSKNIRVSDRSIDRRLGVWSNGFDMRMPVGLASTNKTAVIAWDDTRNADRLTHIQDVYSSTVQHEALGSGSSDALRYAIAALAGLAVVGLILLGVSLASGRRRPKPEPALQPEASRGRVSS